MTKDPSNPPELIPDGYVSLLQALDVYGREIFGDLWTGKELTARSPKKREREVNQGEREYRQWKPIDPQLTLDREAMRAAVMRQSEAAPDDISTDYIPPPDPPLPRTMDPKFEEEILEENSLEDEERARRDEAVFHLYQKLLVAVASKKIFVLKDDLQLAKVTNEMWDEVSPLKIFETGQAAFEKPLVTGHVLILEDWLRENLRKSSKDQSNNKPGRTSLAPDATSRPPKGRPTKEAEIKSAYERLLKDGKVDYGGYMNRLYKPIRDEVKNASEDRDNAKGLGDEAIRKVITEPFRAGKAALNTSP